MKGGMVDYYKIQDEYRAEWVDYVYNLLKAKESLYEVLRGLDGTVSEDYALGYEWGNIEGMIININFMAKRYKKNG